MEEETRTYAAEDWIVHSQFGIGQIKGVDVKGISGEETSYFRIKTTDSTFWMPVDQMDSEVLRPLSTPEDIQQAITVLKNPPEEMSSNYKIRQIRIRQARIRNTPKAIARLIRDLKALQREKGILNSTERSAFRTLKQRLVEEWSLVTGIKTDKIALKLENLLNRRQPAAEGKGSATASKETVAASSTESPPQPKNWGVWSKQQTNKINR
jgi:RNA polymerase-interacting CarD/CdnL/TRCF family regulator